MNLRAINTFVLAVLAAMPVCAQSGSANPSLRYSCLNDKSFLSVTASTPKHDGFPDVTLTLVDPQQRRSGQQEPDEQIPNSRYAKVVEMPEHPQYSRAVAIEVCQPPQGVYSLTVAERENSRYRLTISADGARISHAEPVHLIARRGQIRQFLFRYSDSDGIARIELLTDKGQPITRAESVELTEW